MRRECRRQDAPRSGDAVMIRGYSGKDETFGELGEAIGKAIIELLGKPAK